MHSNGFTTDKPWQLQEHQTAMYEVSLEPSQSQSSLDSCQPCRRLAD